MTAPAGPIAVTNPDRIRTTSPLSHLRQTLVQSYSNPDMKSPTESPTKPPTRSTSYSTMPPSARRLVQQSTEDFVIRTSRSVARDQAQQPPAPALHTTQPPAAQKPQQTQLQHLPRYYTGSDGTQHHWQRPAPIKSRAARGSPPKTQKPIVLRKKAAPGMLFAALPGEVLELILDELKKLHYDDFAHTKSDVYVGEHSSCATCWMRDACAMAMTARKMLKYARAALYEAIEIVGADAVHEQHHHHHHHHFYHHKKQAIAPAAGSARLTLLLRTLRDSPPIAAIVRSLKVPSLALYQAVPGIAAVGASGTIPDDYETLVASVVMSCPNLERVVGFHPTYDHTLHSRYVQALSTRTRLKEMTWVVEPIFTDEQHEEMRQQAARRRDEQALKNKHSKHRHVKGRRSRTRSISAIIRPHSLPSPPASPPLESAALFAAPPSSCTELNPRQSARFLNHHASWHHLTTLTMHCKPGATLAPNAGLLTEAAALLPRLQNLYLSHLPQDAFDDAALLSLPASLRKLSLAHIQGVTSDGLSTFATQPNSKHLTSLSLVHTHHIGGPGGLPALARTLSKLADLTSLTLVQARPPTLAPGETVWLFPYLASASLKHLHWDLPSSTSTSNSADVILARSIAADGFPNLRTLRTPADPEGLFQPLCRPQERVDLPGDRNKSFVTGSHYYPNYPSAFTSHAASSSPPLAHARVHAHAHTHAHHYSESSSASSTSVFSASLAHSRTNSSSLSSSHENGADGRLPHLYEKETETVPLHTDLHIARMAAQARIDASRRTPRFFANVTDEQGTLVDKFGMGGFIGTVGSPITYHLVADAGASDDKGGLVDIEDFLADGGEALGIKEGDTFKAVHVCSGQWNAKWDAPQKKDRERWSHTERGRWCAVKLI
ncbi:hypothetical protein F503_02775 [Ophiostoma piceae UAMH 11346]|uniref:Uncharacterized protein n=1 Tax=Ophiostoma piceae (strain UAMH 11346) TaxID=1262450 RepID=S3C2G3_OPHP1|nr:hypothetical protein F503_02775 [Ophiostoma piceae UAMH 11346]